MFDKMTKEEALDYCYKYENKYKAEMYECGEDGEREFGCLIMILDGDTIQPKDLPDYGMNYEDEQLNKHKMELGKVDLRECKKGDILISSHGDKLKYCRPTIKGEYLDHRVQYVESTNGDKYTTDCFGTRSHDGYVFMFNRLPEKDHDIVEIIKK